MIDSDDDYTIYKNISKSKPKLNPNPNPNPKSTIIAICENKTFILDKYLSRINTYNGQTINFIIIGVPNTSIVIKKEGIEYKNDIIGVGGKYKFSYFAEKSAKFLVQIGSNIDIINFKIKVYKFKFIHDFAIMFKN